MRYFFVLTACTLTALGSARNAEFSINGRWLVAVEEVAICGFVVKIWPAGQLHQCWASRPVRAGEEWKVRPVHKEVELTAFLMTENSRKDKKICYTVHT